MKRTLPLLMATAALSLHAPAQTHTVLKVFSPSYNESGFYSYSPFVQGPDGALYGTCQNGGTGGGGTVFRLQPDGTGFTVIKAFASDGKEGVGPRGALVVDGWALYGTTQGGGTNGGYGTVFKLNIDGTGYAVLKHFANTNGAYPWDGLVLSGSTLYGTTLRGPGYGTVFKVNTNGSGFAILWTFTGNDGVEPMARLVLGGNTLYGTTSKGGQYWDAGTVFKVNTDGTGFSVLMDNGSFADLVLSGSTLYGQMGDTVFKLNSDGTGYGTVHTFSFAGPHAGLFLSGNTLYGTTLGGGTNGGGGVVFKVNTDGTGYTQLRDLSPEDGNTPDAGVLVIGNTLFGTTLRAGSSGSDMGTIFKVSTAGADFAVLKEFTPRDGKHPYASLALGSNTLYGTTPEGGASGRGTVFKVNTDGSGFAVIKHFPSLPSLVENTNSDGAAPYAELVLSGGTLYGIASTGGNSGNGTVFELNTDGTGFTVLKHLTGSNVGAAPGGSLVLSGSTLYGTTPTGGNTGGGMIFKISTNASGYTVLKSFDDGVNYGPGPVVMSGGTLYGTLAAGWSDGGRIFKINTNGSGFTVLKIFSQPTQSPGGDYTNSTGAYPVGGLVVSGSTLYGTASQGGSSGCGTVFKQNTNGSGFTVLRDLTFLDGWKPLGKLALNGDTLYGTMSMGYGAVFKISTNGSGYAVLKAFNGDDGSRPQSGVVMEGDTLYGTTAWGGIDNHWLVDEGTVFRIDLPAPPLLGMAWSAGSPQLRVFGQLGSRVALEWTPTLNASNNWKSLMHWTNVMLTNSPQIFSDTSSSGTNQRFYRAVLLP